jgi:hypothetical protein
MIYYLCLDEQSPSGGRRVAYRHVDILNQNGIEASVMHAEPGFRLNWFENDTRISYASQTALQDDDILVMPETRGPEIHKAAIGHKYVIFNQGVYQTFLHYQGNETITPYHHSNLLGVMCVSENSFEYLRFAFPHLAEDGRLRRIHISVDHDLFRYVPLHEKKRQVAFMSRKHPKDVFQVVTMLKLREVLDWNFILIDKMPESEVARIMRESMIYLEFGYPAGCPVPPLEALSSGCHVIGYTGFGGDEYAFKVTNFTNVQHGDVSTFAKVIENTCQYYDQVMESEGLLTLTEKRTERDAKYIKEVYNREIETADVLAFWEGALK